MIVPILAIRDAEGRTLVREGQCRTLGAREVGLTAVPVYVLPANTSDADTATIERIVQQMVANDQRHGLTNSQRARAIQQMLETGMSTTKVAKKLSMRREDVKAAGAVSKSTAALDALDDGQLDFAQAEVLAEFEADEDAVERLLRAARYGATTSSTPSQACARSVRSMRSPRWPRRSTPSAGMRFCKIDHSGRIWPQWGWTTCAPPTRRSCPPIWRRSPSTGRCT